LTDKQQHFLGGFCIAIVVADAAGFAGLALPAVMGMFAATAVGAWKEWIYDAARIDTHTVDKYDFLATVAGGIAGAVAFSVIQKVFTWTL
jgi:hypothetical protein